MPATPKLPSITLIIVGLAVIVSSSPILSPWFEWDRAAIAGGQWWRLATGNLVHFTPRHLLLDAVVVVAVGSMIETRTRRSLAVVSLIAASAIGVCIYLLCPAVRFYGGLSGIACAMCGYLAVLGVQAGKRARWTGLAMLALLAGKIGLESATGLALFGVAAGDGCVVLPAAHATGAVCGAVLGCWPAKEVETL